MSFEWKDCPRCGIPCVLRPLSVIKDQDGKRFGFRFCCPECSYYNPDVFVSFTELQDYQRQQTTTNNKQQQTTTTTTTENGIVQGNLACQWQAKFGKGVD